MSQMSLFEVAPCFTGRRTNAVTFKGKMTLPIHRWYRLTPSFSPQLAHDIADHFALDADDYVLDPFSGVGTVPVCMKYRGIPSCSVEINPYLQFVGTVKTRSYSDVPAIRQTFDDFHARFAAVHATLPSESKAASYLVEHARFVPPIHKPERWWSPGNLMQLTCLRQLLLAYEAQPEHLDLIRMAVLGILVPVSNAKHNHVSLTFDETPLPTLNVAGVLRAKFDQMIEDLDAVADLPRAAAKVFAGNSKALASVIPGHLKFSAVITSPPYPNRFSYARETRPHLFYMNFLNDPAQVGELEIQSIGGTWGKATSVLADGVEPANEIVRAQLQPFTQCVNGSGKLMASYVTKYFNDIYTHAGEVAKVTRPGAKLAYVIGNSKFYNHPLPSDEILAAIFGHFGFALDRIDKMRRRQSKSGLYEAVVFMNKQ